MFNAQLALLIGLAVSSAGNEDLGMIRGVVVNATQRGMPSAQTEVVLRVQIHGQFVPVAKTVTDEQGKFQFVDLPASRGYLYLPGANRGDVHYPGARIRVTSMQPTASVKLEVCDTVTNPSPLVIMGQDIAIKPDAGALRVTESLLIRNPTATTYVGQPVSAGAEPVTLTLAIPPDFDRATFHEEFYGRNFSVRGDKVVTGIPWTPGLRELKFTYTLRSDQRQRVWQRPLDLPCEHLRLRIQHDKPDEVTCNLDRSTQAASGEIVFESRGRMLPAGHVIRVELARLPISWMVYARWAALALLVALVALAGAVVRRKNRHAATMHAAPSSQVSQGNGASKPRARSEPATRRQRRRRAA